MMKGLIRQQEERFAAKLLLWQYRKAGLEPPAEPDMTRRAVQLVADAHRIGAERGRNVLTILKELVESVIRK